MFCFEPRHEAALEASKAVPVVKIGWGFVVAFQNRPPQSFPVLGWLEELWTIASNMTRIHIMLGG